MTITAEAPIIALDAVAAQSSEADMQNLRAELDRLDAEILANVRRRAEMTRREGLARVDAGLPQVTRSGEIDVLRRFEEHLGRDGVSLGMVLLRMGRTDPSRN